MSGTCLLLPFLSLVTLAGAPAGDDRYARPELLVEPAQLAAQAASERPLILDARPASDYAEAHVAGAVWVNHDQWSKNFDGRDADLWSQRIGSLGLDRDTRVVVYDNSMGRDAARIWWILRYWGVDDAAVLNGGWKQWQAIGGPTSGTASVPAQADFRAQPHPDRYADASQILDSLAGSTLQVVDARSLNEHCGINGLSNKRSGAIPGARHLEWSDLIVKDTHRFKPAGELRRLFHEAGIDLRKPSATHCQSGGRASVMAFALELMGADQVRNYYRGWSEWGNREDTPVAPGDPASG